jgi:hypothetical protein
VETKASDFCGFETHGFSHGKSMKLPGNWMENWMENPMNMI